jgi:hypothetical protein
MDYYFEQSELATSGSEWSIAQIRDALKRVSCIRPHPATILRYNERQRKKRGVSPLAKVGPNTYALNHEYYRSLRDKVVPPGRTPKPSQEGCEPSLRMETPRGRPRKYPYDDALMRVRASRQRPESVSYQVLYHRFYRCPETSILGELFKENDSLDTQTVQRILCERISTKFGPQAVSTLLGRYASRARGPPYIEEVEPGIYRRIRGPPADGKASGGSLSPAQY